MKIPKSNSLVLIGAGFLLPMIAARATRSLVGRGYTLITDEEVPKNPANSDVVWRDALIWAAVSGLIGGITKLTIRRLLAESMIPAEGDDMDEAVEEIA